MEIVIYGKEDCQYCDNAKKICKLRNKEFTYLQLGVDYKREELVAKVPALKTYPAVFINGTWIGGYDDLMKVIR